MAEFDVGDTVGAPTAAPVAGHLLVASPVLPVPFWHAVILLLEHDDTGTLGVVLNQPTDVDVSGVLPSWSEHVSGASVLYQGGPVALDSALAVAAAKGAPPRGFRSVSGPVGVVDLDAAAADVAPHLDALRVFAGYAGWSPGQLDAELSEGAWAVIESPSLSDDIFVADADSLWSAVLRRAGGTLAWWPQCPADPSLN